MFLMWSQNGSLREGHFALLTRQVRAEFKLALKHCRINEKQLRADAMSRKL